jgi:hypothetical protein
MHELKPKNPNCDGNNCTSNSGEVRLLPTGAGGNMIVCRQCFNHELRYRSYRNIELEMFAFEIPTWEQLCVYISE